MAESRPIALDDEDPWAFELRVHLWVAKLAGVSPVHNAKAPSFAKEIRLVLHSPLPDKHSFVRLVLSRPKAVGFNKQRTSVLYEKGQECTVKIEMFGMHPDTRSADVDALLAILQTQSHAYGLATFWKTALGFLSNPKHLGTATGVFRNASAST